MNHGETIAAAKANWERQGKDWYPTPPETTQALVNRLGLATGLRVLEPCCGEGHISRVLEAAGYQVTSHDLRHTGYGEGGVDYLTKPEHPGEGYEYDAVITNPPFVHAEAFIRRALRDAPIVAMLLPSNYWHARSRSRLFETRPPQAILALTFRPAFLAEERGTSPLSNFNWVVWMDADGPGYCTYHVVDRPPVWPRHDLTVPVQMGRAGVLDAMVDAIAARHG